MKEARYYNWLEFMVNKSYKPYVNSMQELNKYFKSMFGRTASILPENSHKEEIVSAMYELKRFELSRRKYANRIDFDEEMSETTNRLIYECSGILLRWYYLKLYEAATVFDVDCDYFDKHDVPDTSEIDNMLNECDSSYMLEFSFDTPKYEYAVGVSMERVPKKTGSDSSMYFAIHSNVLKSMKSCSLARVSVEMPTVYMRLGSSRFYISDLEHGSVKKNDDCSYIYINDGKTAVKSFGIDELFKQRDLIKGSTIDVMSFVMHATSLYLIGTHRYKDAITNKIHKTVKSSKAVSTHTPSSESGVSFGVKSDGGGIKFIPIEQIKTVKNYEKKEWQGGHHKSPKPHDVSGHTRHYKNGKIVEIAAYHKPGNGSEISKKIIDID